MKVKNSISTTVNHRQFVLWFSVSAVVIVLLASAWLVMKLGLNPNRNLSLPAAEYSIYSPNGEWITNTFRWPDKPTVTVLDATNGKIITSFSDADGVNIAFSPDNTLLVIADAQSVEIWNTNTWTLTSNIDLHTFVCHVDFEDSFNLLVVGACGSDGIFISNDNSSLEQVATFPDWEVSAMTVAYQHSTIAVALHSYPNNRIAVVDLSSGEITNDISVPPLINDIAWTYDDRYIVAAGENGLVYIWDAENLEEVASIEQIGTVELVDVSHDSKILAAGGQQPTTLYHWDTWEEIAQLGSENISSIRFNPANSNNLVVAYWDINKVLDLSTTVFDISDVVNQ